MSCRPAPGAIGRSGRGGMAGRRVDHKGVVRVVDDCSKFHLQNSVELLDDDIDVKLESPCHRGSPSPWRDSGLSIRYYRVSTAWQRANGSTLAAPSGEERESLI